MPLAFRLNFVSSSQPQNLSLLCGDVRTLPAHTLARTRGSHDRETLGPRLISGLTPEITECFNFESVSYLVFMTLVVRSLPGTTRAPMIEVGV